jgi:hypothetical protein
VSLCYCSNVGLPSEMNEMGRFPSIRFGRSVFL